MKTLADLTLSDYAKVNGLILRLADRYGVQGARARLPSLLEGKFSAIAIQRFQERVEGVVAAARRREAA